MTNCSSRWIDGEIRRGTETETGDGWSSGVSWWHLLLQLAGRPPAQVSYPSGPFSLAAVTKVTACQHRPTRLPRAGEGCGGSLMHHQLWWVCQYCLDPGGAGPTVTDTGPLLRARINTHFLYCSLISWRSNFNQSYYMSNQFNQTLICRCFFAFIK